MLHDRVFTVIWFFGPNSHRYGREDEEVMGLKFCNEAIIALKQIWPVPEDSQEVLSALQVGWFLGSFVGGVCACIF